MKITTPNVHLAYKTLSKSESKIASKPESSTLQGKDGLELSGAAKALTALIKDGADVEEISMRAIEIKDMLSSGTYDFSVDRLAGRLADLILQERSLKE